MQFKFQFQHANGNLDDMRRGDAHALLARFHNIPWAEEIESNKKNSKSTMPTLRVEREEDGDMLYIDGIADYFAKTVVPDKFQCAVIMTTPKKSLGFIKTSDTWESGEKEMPAAKVDEVISHFAKKDLAWLKQNLS